MSSSIACCPILYVSLSCSLILAYPGLIANVSSDSTVKGYQDDNERMDSCT